MTKTMRRLLGVACLSLSVGLMATDNAHNYKAPHWYGSLPVCHFGDKVGNSTRDWLSTFDASVGFGSTRSSWDKNGNTSNLLNETGDYNMLYLMENVAMVNPTFQNFANFLGNAQVQHARNPSPFGQLRFHGKFEITDFDLAMRQNFIKGFFLEASLPIRDMKISEIGYTDMSPATGNAGFNKQRYDWVQFKNQLDTLLGNYGLKPHATSWDNSGVGDLTVLLGWEHIWNKQCCKRADCVKKSSCACKDCGCKPWFGMTLKAGALFPTGEKDDQSYVFSLPTGYNEHYGLVGYGQLTGGVKYFTLRGFGGFTYFFDDTEKTRHMKTFAKQQGYIKLASGLAEEEKGMLWHAGGDVSFDHIFSGFSLRAGYSFTKQEHDTLTPANTTLFPTAVVNGDSTLAGWYQHTAHFMLDWDLSTYMKKSHWAPRLAAFYDWNFDGKNAFKTDIVGGKVGLDIRWKI